MKQRLMPPSYLLIAGIMSFVLHTAVPIRRIVSPPYTFFGVLVAVIGIVLNLWADHLFKQHRTTVKPDELPSVLISSGPFTISRHPMYLGMALVLLGEGMLLGSLMACIPLLLFVLLMELWFIPQEEKNMKRAFGKAYRDYQQKVRKWI